MKKYPYLLAILAMLFWKNNCPAQVTDSARIVSSLTKCWRAVSHEFSPIYGLEDEEIKRYSKQRLCFTRDSISLYYGVLYAPKYVIKKVNADDYAKGNFDCSKQKLDIFRDSVYEVTILSTSKPAKDGSVHKMTDVIAFDEDCIYVVVDGVIFKLFDADRKAEARSSN